MEMNNNNQFVTDLLASSRYRILRHLILFMLVVSLTIGFVWFMKEDKHLNGVWEVCGCMFLFVVLILGGIYLNIYVLAPGFLLKNRWGIYICLLLGVAVLILLFIVFIQVVFPGKGIPSSGVDYFAVTVNILSSIISFFLLLAGSTTLLLFKYWVQDMQQAAELESATLQLELKLLENQINPHFLFNMLNNANIMIKADPDRAVHIIAKLEEMLRYQMDESSRTLVSLNEEIGFLNDFLELENTRRDYFSYDIAGSEELDGIQVPPLLFITFVENAVKHNQDSRTASYVHITFEKIGRMLVFVCENSIPRKPSGKQVGGIGLANIERRLRLLYKDGYSLEQTKTEINYRVKLELKI